MRRGNPGLPSACGGRELRRDRDRDQPGRPVPPCRSGEGGQAGGARRARQPGWRVCEHRVHPYQDDGRQRAPGVSGATRRRVRRADRAGVGRPGRGARAQADDGGRRAGELREPAGAGRARPDRGRGPVHRSQDGRGRPWGRQDTGDRCTGDRHRHRLQAQAAGARRSGGHRRPGLDVDHGAGRPARAPGHSRRRLHRAGVRPDVPQVRQRGHDRPDRPATADGGGRRRLGRGRRDPARRGHHDPDVGDARTGRGGRWRPGAADRPHAERRAAHRGLPPDVGHRPRPQHRGPDHGGGRNPAARQRLGRGRRVPGDLRPRCVRDGRRQGRPGLHTPLVRRLPDPARQPARRAEGEHAGPDRSLHRLHRPAARPRRHDRAAGQGAGPGGPGRKAAHELRHPGAGDRGDARLHEGRRRRGHRGDPRRRRPRRGGRRDHDRHPGRHAGQAPLHGHGERSLHAPAAGGGPQQPLRGIRRAGLTAGSVAAARTRTVRLPFIDALRRRLWLRAAGGGLPGVCAGAHVSVRLLGAVPVQAHH
ncbi:hypothetical protein SCOCK_10050 [Actinacidiphila cocklensis]|uniref:Uncharacterized protein n=1 Tax=Actinacidiphila cocklensis TaxID=887465 RepID=A0A9W4GMT0_9ACTN|nr:hypothetical protein SCOCK_10050 [Actinacidiphila cocklensis]